MLMGTMPPGHSVRIDIAMALWSRILDPHQAFYIWLAAGIQLREEALARIGWLNLYNPFMPHKGNAPSGGWRLSLEIPEQRAVALSLLQLGHGSDGKLTRATYRK